MKKSTKLLSASLVGAAALSVSSCGKYEDGPNFSLLTKKSRLTGDWVVKSIGSETFINDYGLSINFDKNGSMKYTYSVGANSESYSGTWDFSSDKENLIFTTDGDSDTLEIKRLTNKELWLDDDYSSADGDIWKLESK